jgi:CubicO group peptidase (beta-lactamase class C family)
VGDYYWVGSSGPSFWADPREELCAVLMMRAPAQLHQFRRQLRQLVYAAIE